MLTIVIYHSKEQIKKKTSNIKLMFYSVKHNQLRIQKISNIVKFYNIKQHRKLYILVQYSEELKKKR